MASALPFKEKKKTSCSPKRVLNPLQGEGENIPFAKALV
jgi:hypothetical protein